MPEDRQRKIRNIAIAVGAPLAAIGAMVTVWLLWWRPRNGGGSSTAPPGTTDGAAGENGGDAGDHGAGQGDSGGGSDGNSSGDGCDGCGQDTVDGCLDDSCNEASSCDSGCQVGDPCSGGTAALVVVPFKIAGTFGVRTAVRTPTVPARVGRAAIGAYRRWISPRTRARCRYTPSCSSYGMTVIERHGLAGGARLALARIRRCTADVPRGTPDPPP